MKGFVICCLECLSMEIKIELFPTGLAFKCKKCGSELLLQPGDIMEISKNKDVENENWVDNILDDWKERNKN